MAYRSTSFFFGWLFALNIDQYYFEIRWKFSGSLIGLTDIELRKILIIFCILVAGSLDLELAAGLWNEDRSGIFNSFFETQLTLIKINWLIGQNCDHIFMVKFISQQFQSKDSKPTFVFGCAFYLHV